MSIRKRTPTRWRVPIEGARITHPQFLQIVYGFAHDYAATDTAELSGVSTRTASSIYRVLRRRLMAINFSNLPEIDEHELEEYHQRRNRWRSGWRKEDRAAHLTESSIRLAIGHDSRFWLYGVMLDAIYNRPIERRELK